MTIAILQVFTGTWIIVGVYETKEKAELAATVSGYVNRSISEWGVS